MGAVRAGAAGSETRPEAHSKSGRRTETKCRSRVALSSAIRASGGRTSARRATAATRRRRRGRARAPPPAPRAPRAPPASPPRRRRRCPSASPPRAPPRAGRRRARRRRRVAAVGVGRRQQRERQLELSGVERAAVVVEEPRARLGDDARRARARRADEPQRHRRVGREVAVVGAEAQPLVPPQLRARRVARPLGLADRPAVRVQLAPHLDVGRRHARARLDERRVREARVGRRAVHRADADFDGQRDVAREGRAVAPTAKGGRPRLRRAGFAQYLRWPGAPQRNLDNDQRDRSSTLRLAWPRRAPPR